MSCSIDAPIIEASLHGVHSLTVHEFYLAAINMDERTQTEVREFFEVVLGHKKNADPSFRLNRPAFLFGAVHDVLAKPLDQALLCVNLQLPDRELVEQFKAYLPKLREECQAQYYKSKWHKPDFLEWERLRVLPFLDLLLWQAEQNVKFTFNNMEQILFPDGESSEDRVRKTTAPKANELVSERFLTVLYNLATSELGKRSQDSRDSQNG